MLGISRALPFATALTLLTVSGAASAAEAAVGRQIRSFTLRDCYGDVVALSDFSKHRAVVVCFLGTQCPLAKFYGPRLQEMSSAFKGKGVAFVGVNANQQDSLSEIAAYARRHKIKFPILKDLKGEVAEQIGATRTPEVFLLDQDRVIRYQGRVDAQFSFGAGVGLAQPKATRADLKIAIEEVLKGRPVTVPFEEARGCLLGRVRKLSDEPTVTYATDIAPLLQKHCVKCHRKGQIAPFALETHGDAASWGEMIAEVVREKRMPPWHAGEQSTVSFLNDARLSENEKSMIYRWVDEGCPLGDPADLPPPRTFSKEWFTEDEFDDVIYMADQPVPVKAHGVEEYRYYELPGFEEDRWVKATECLPGNHAVVHHIIVYARPPGGEPILPGATGVDTQHFSWLTGYAPGTRPLKLPQGWAKLIPAGYSLVFEMHYTPIGTPQTDRSAIGLVYTERDKVERLLHTSSAINTKFVIPPHASDHRVDAEYTFDSDTTLLALFPHMHVRGKSFRYVLQRPDGKRRLLLDVPFYDFNWQNSYILEQQLPVPAGSKLRVTARFDNSERNLANPDPKKEVRWGEQSWEEMMIGFFDHGVTIKRARELLEQQANELEAARTATRSDAATQ